MTSCSYIPTVGTSVTIGEAKYVFNGGGSCFWSGVVELEIGADLNLPSRRVQGVVLRSGDGDDDWSDYMFCGLIETPSGAAGIGMYYDSGLDAWVSDAGLEARGGDLALHAVGVGFEDAALDVDGDGRFAANDATALNDLIPSTDPSDLMRWDFDRSGEIGEPDVEFLQMLLSVGLGAGVLGDFNLDNVADCDDLAAILDAIDNEEDPFDDYVIGDAEYRIELDADLDGDNDADDWYIIYGLLQPADINRDGEVNSVDFVQYLNLYNAQDPAADMNGDGQVNSVDFVIYLNYYNNPC